MGRMLAIIEREMRKFFRSPVLMLLSMVVPLLQLVILGNAFGGKIHGTKVGVVDHDHGPQAVLLQENFDAVASNLRTFTTVRYSDEVQAREDVRTGRIDAAVIIPSQFSRRMYAQDAPNIALVVDNSDQFTSSSIETVLQQMVNSLNQPTVLPDRLSQQAALEIVELYPYIEYMKFLLSGSIALAMYVSVLIGGGLLYIDDKARGVHEGYLVTPITRLELVMGMNGAGALKAVLSGVTMTVIGSLLARLGTIFNPMADLELIAIILVTALAFNGMMFLMMVRVEDPLVPRAMFGVLNTLLFFPAGSIYPISAFPQWLKAIAIVDPFTYSIHAFKAVLLKDGGWSAIYGDLLFLGIFGTASLALATPLFKRSL